MAVCVGVALPLLLVVAGAALGALPMTPEVVLEPDLFLTVLLPPLIYAAAQNVPFVDFRRSIQVIVLLAVVLVVLSALAVGGLVHLASPSVPLALAIRLGAVVAPPDAVASTAIARRMGLPKRDVTILEGEALVNDATALVLLSIASAAAVSGASTAAGQVALQLLLSILAALIVGVAVGFAAVKLRKLVHDAVLDTAISLVTPFAAFLGAEAMHGSGIVAVVVAGLAVGNLGLFAIPVEGRRSEASNWASFAHLLENGAFLYPGYRLPDVIADVERTEGRFLATLGLALLVVAVLVIVRMAFMPVLILSIKARARSMRRQHERETTRFAKAKAYFAEVEDERVLSRLRQFGRRLRRRSADLTAENDQSIAWRDGLVLGWAGMRGVVTVMAVETLSALDESSRRLVLVAGIVAVATLLAQGLTLAPIARAPGLRDEASASLDDEVRELQLLLVDRARAAAEAAAAHDGSPRRRWPQCTSAPRVDQPAPHRRPSGRATATRSPSPRRGSSASTSTRSSRRCAASVRSASARARRSGRCSAFSSASSSPIASSWRTPASSRPSNRMRTLGGRAMAPSRRCSPPRSL